MGSTNDRLTEIARIGKAHGLEGFVKLHLSEKFKSFIEKGKLLYLRDGRGNLIPTRITEVRVEKKRNVHSFFVKFDGIDNRSGAEAFQDRPLHVVDSTNLHEANIEELRPDEITGYRVTDPTGTVGIVISIIQNPAHPIIEVELTDNPSHILLIPWVDEYVQSVDEDDKLLTCQNLNQLKEI